MEVSLAVRITQVNGGTIIPDTSSIIYSVQLFDGQGDRTVAELTHRQLELILEEYIHKNGYWKNADDRHRDITG